MTSDSASCLPACPMSRSAGTPVRSPGMCPGSPGLPRSRAVRLAPSRRRCLQMEVRSPQQHAAARLRASPLPAGFIVSNRWMEHHGGPALRRPSPGLVRPVSSPPVTWPSAQLCCRVPVPFQSVVLSREGTACPAALTGLCPAHFHPKAQARWTARSCREAGEVSRPFQLSPSGLPRVVALSVLLPFPRPRYTGVASALTLSGCRRPRTSPGFKEGRSVRCHRHLDHASSLQYVKEQFRRSVLSVLPPVACPYQF